MVFIASLAFSQQTLLTEGFDTFPPTGWTTADVGGPNWLGAASNNAGGTMPEAELTWSPQFQGIGRLISPAINTAGGANMHIGFKHFVNNYGTGGTYTLGCATTSDGATWNEVWSVAPAASIGPETIDVDLTGNPDVGSGNFQISFYLNGNSFDINQWYVDDVTVTGLLNPATITGTVTLQGGPGAVTNVAVTAGSFVAHPLANGTYSLPVSAGTYNLTATLFGYAPQTITGLTLVTGQTLANQNFTLVPNTNVTVTGTVTGSDQPAVGLVGAEISLHGISDYTGVTGANGVFTIGNVWANETYQITIEYLGYETYHGTVVTGNSDTNFGTLTINEMTSPPRHVVATQSNDFQTAYLAWNSPNYSQSSLFDFEESNGEFVSDNATGWGWGVDATAGNHSPTHVWKTCLNAQYPTSCNFTLISSPIDVGGEAFLSFWHNLCVENTWDGGNVKISTDNGATWTLINPVGGYTVTAMSTANAAIPGEPGYTCTSSGTWTGWAQASFDLAAYDGQTVLFKWSFGSDGSVQYDGWAIDDVFVGQPEVRNSRVQLGYNIYRLLLGQEENPGSWTQIATNVADSTYTYADWATQPSGLYKFAVRTFYTNSVESEPELSNWLGKDYYTSATVNVSAVSGDNVTGAEVTLTCQDADPDGMFNEYTGLVANGTCSFPLVWKGMYTLTVSFDNFQTYEQTNINIQTPTTLPVTLTEQVFPVGSLNAQVVADDVTLTWHLPSGETVFDFEANNGDFVSDNASGWGWGVDATAGNHSPVNIWKTCLNGQYPASCAYNLISAPIDVTSDAAYLTFWYNICVENYFDGGNVKISTDNGATWTLITPEEGYNEDAFSTSNACVPGEPGYTSASSGTWSGWTLTSFNLAAYDGQTVLFKWAYGADSSVQYDGWAIDDVRVGELETRTRNVARVDHMNRELLGYDIFRSMNGGTPALIVDNQNPTTVTYSDMNRPDGDYTYDVYAVYTTGTSESRSVSVQVYPLNIIGYVNGSDAPTVGLAGATIEIQNDDYYFAGVTNNTGNFAINDINGMQTYTVTIAHDGYDTFETELTVTSLDVVMGTVAAPITLQERITPVSNVQAVESGDGNSVDISWNLPGNGAPTEFRYDDGTPTAQLGWNSHPNAMFGAVYYHAAILNTFTWYQTDEGGPHTTTNIFVTGLTADGLPDPTNILFQQDGVAVTDNEWMTVEIGNVACPEGFFLGVTSSDSFIGVGTDDGLGDPYPFISATQYVCGDYTAPEWQDIGTAGFSVNYTIRAQGLDMGPIDRPARTVAHSAAKMDGPTMAVNSRLVAPVAHHVDAPVYTHDNHLTRMLNAIRRETNNSRELTGFKVSRLNVDDIGNPNNWTVLVANQAADDSLYTDTGWATVEAGVYKWAVFALFTSGVSDPMFSNEIPHNMEHIVTIHVTNNAGDSPLGTVVSLVNQDGNPEHQYSVTVPNNGNAALSVWGGMYDVTASLNHFQQYTNSNFGVDQDVTLNINLIEALNPISQLAGEVNQTTGDVNLTWTSPYDAGANFSEDFEGGALPEGWEIIATSTDASHAIPAYWTVNDYVDETNAIIPNGTYDAGLWWSNDAQDEWLITPEFSCGAGTTVSFATIVYLGSTYDDHYRVEVSDDGGETWTSVWDATELAGAAYTTMATPYEVDLSDFAGSSIQLAFHAYDTDGAGIWWWWLVDDVAITTGGRVLHFSENSLFHTRNAHRFAETDRHLTGYNITCEGNPVATGVTTTSYLAPHPGHGLFTYAVTAVYSSGTSPAVTIQVNDPANSNQNASPFVTALQGNNPNPFNPETAISFTLATESHVSIEIYNLRGQKVSTLLNDNMSSGAHKVLWNGTDSNGKPVASGVYTYKMKSGAYTCTRKMIMLK